MARTLGTHTSTLINNMNPATIRHNPSFHPLAKCCPNDIVYRDTDTQDTFDLDLNEYFLNTCQKVTVRTLNENPGIPSIEWGRARVKTGSLIIIHFIEIFHIQS